MRTILELLAGVAVALLSADAASPASQPPANSAVPQRESVPPVLGPVGGCPPGYAQDPKAVFEATQSSFDQAQRERAIAAIPCVRVDAAGTAGVHPASSRAIPKPPH
jgi:hypothetical protein